MKKIKKCLSLVLFFTVLISLFSGIVGNAVAKPIFRKVSWGMTRQNVIKSEGKKGYSEKQMLQYPGSYHIQTRLN